MVLNMSNPQRQGMDQLWYTAARWCFSCANALQCVKLHLSITFVKTSQFLNDYKIIMFLCQSKQPYSDMLSPGVIVRP